MAVIRLPDKVFTGDFSDVVAPVSGDNNKALVWNQTNQRAEWMSVVTSPGGSSGQVQYSNAGALAGHSGFVYDGAGKVTLSAALVSPDIRSAANAVNSTGFSNASGTRVLSVDTTNSRVGIGTTTPSCRLDINGNGTTAIANIYGYSNVAYSTGVSVGFTAQGTSYHSALSGTIYSGAGAGVTTPSISGLSFKAAHGDASTITSLIGVSAVAQKSGANVGNTTLMIGLSPELSLQSTGTPPTTSNAYLIKGSVAKSGVDVVTAMYGIYLPDISIGGQNYSIYTNAGDVRLMSSNSDKIAFHGVTPVARQLLATGVGRTVDDVITFLQNLGLARQS